MPTLRILIVLALLTQSALAATRLTVEAGDVDRRNSPAIATVKSDLEPGLYELKPATGKPIVAQVQRTGDSVVIRWIEPELAKGQARTYTLARNTSDSTPAFHFADSDGHRDLLFAGKPVWRDMTKYDPADRESTYKVYTHVFAFNDDTLITKGPGGKFPHHRGIFFGFKAFDGDKPLGDFWHCPDVTQRHAGYLADQEFTGPVAAREVSQTNWVAKDDKPVIRDIRAWTTWRISPTQYIYDYDITVESLISKPLKITADAHHAGFHFRAAQEVADAKDGGAKYIRPATAKDTGNDIWSGCPWVHTTFTVADHTYQLTHLDAPGNPMPTTYSTRPYGRVGAFFTTEVPATDPLKLHYRLILSEGGTPTPDQLADFSADLASPVKVRLEN